MAPVFPVDFADNMVGDIMPLAMPSTNGLHTQTIASAPGGKQSSALEATLLRGSLILLLLSFACTLCTEHDATCIMKVLVWGLDLRLQSQAAQDILHVALQEHDVLVTHARSTLREGSIRKTFGRVYDI